ncbi:tripartite tricarboxylate transporter substrate binding protein [Roseomonas sp. PWR1]|uniref:Tripartite tricarboxylate transporter substrate binding protein n=1 Tax=Roseomonas nitratireducens TaxID=2820810 RepID=A0ABS4AY43_9PROT|nr:tripartite tricarboxylate transporter substrate binding protein [Neoroseomonas nitratireducens]MBP0466293.1 tripartite tricarboxylate transporter substrate binding protein [Neoroseomonas nitratireducens]
MPGIARRSFVLGAITLPAIARPTGAAWTPGGPVALIVPFAEGGSNDDVMRAIAEAAGARLGQPIRVQNKPGRGGVRAIAALASAPSDGRLVAQLPYSAIRTALLEGLPFEAERDATPILGLAGSAYGAIAKADRFPDGWAGFLREAREKPGTLSYGTPGVNSTPHLTMARLLLRERIQAVHVPFRGTMHGARAVVAGDVDIMAGPVRIGALVQDGEAAWMHVWSAQRLPRWPDAPTLRELGYRLTVTAPFGIVAPPGLPAEAATALHDAFLAALRTTEVRAMLERHDMTEDYRDGGAYTAFLAETARMEEMLIGRLGLQP